MKRFPSPREPKNFRERCRASASGISVRHTIRAYPFRRGCESHSWIKRPCGKISVWALVNVHSGRRRGDNVRSRSRAGARARVAAYIWNLFLDPARSPARYDGKSRKIGCYSYTFTDAFNPRDDARPTLGPAFLLVIPIRRRRRRPCRPKIALHTSLSRVCVSLAGRCG